MISVFIADDHPMFVRGLRRFFEEEPGFRVAGTAPDGQQAWEQLQELRPDLAILDMAMPHMTGVEVAEQLDRSRIGTKVVLLTGTNQVHDIYRSMAAGACGYLLKTADWSDLADALRDVQRGSIIIAPEIMGSLAAQIKSNAGDGLTAREAEILTLVSKGNTVHDIAKSLTIAPATVKTHIRHIYEKLGVNSQASAVAEAIRRRIIK